MDGYMDPNAAADESIRLQPDKFVELKTSKYEMFSNVIQFSIGIR